MKKILFAVLLLAVVVISGCVGQQVQPTDGAVREFNIESSEFKFNPASITVNKGDRVKVNFKNVGSTGHNFVIGELGVSTKVIHAGFTETVEFTVGKSGTFAFYCSVPGHRAAGMEGQISIS